MKSFEFCTQAGATGSIQLPVEIASQVDPDSEIKVIVLVPDDDEERQWVRFGMDQFARGYAPEDSIYDDLRGG